jgi:hypothetical protein
MERAASRVGDGELPSTQFMEKCVSPALAYIVEVERGEVKVGGSEEMSPWALTVTMVFRAEGGE